MTGNHLVNLSGLMVEFTLFEVSLIESFNHLTFNR